MHENKMQGFYFTANKEFYIKIQCEIEKLENAVTSFKYDQLRAESEPDSEEHWASKEVIRELFNMYSETFLNSKIETIKNLLYFRRRNCS